jgi:hypothetical protein
MSAFDWVFTEKIIIDFKKSSIQFTSIKDAAFLMFDVKNLNLDALGGNLIRFKTSKI